MITLNSIAAWLQGFFPSGRVAAVGGLSPRLFPVDAVSAPGHHAPDPAAPEALPILPASVAPAAVQAPVLTAANERIERMVAMISRKPRPAAAAVAAAPPQSGPTLADLEAEFAALSIGEKRAIEAEVARLKAPAPAAKPAGSDATADVVVPAPALRGRALAAYVFSKQFAKNNSTGRFGNRAASANQEMIDQEAGKPAEGTRAGVFGRSRAAAAWTAEFAKKS